MAIPLAEIPNAPTGVNPVLTSVPQANTNLMRSAAQLQTPSIQQGAFDGAAQGAQAIGDAVAGLGERGARVAAIISDAQRRKQAFQDEVSLATYKRKMSEDFERYKGTLQGISEDEWQPGWQKRFESASSAYVQELKLSPEGQQRLAIENQQMQMRFNTDLIANANRSAIERGTGELLAAADTAFKTGNFEEGAATLGKLVDLGAIREDQANNRIEQARQDRDKDVIASMLMTDPHGLLDQLEKGEAVSDEVYGEIDLTPVDRLRMKEQARQAVRQSAFDADQQLDELVFRGEIKSEEEIRKYGEENRMPAAAIAAQIKAFNQNLMATPQGFERLQEARLEIEKELAKFDPEQDAKDEGYFGIKFLIKSTLPEGEREEMLAKLKDKRDTRLNAPDIVRKNVVEQIDNIAKTGFFYGKNEVPKKPKKEESLAAVQRQQEIIRLFDDWVKQNGGNVKQADANQWLSENITQDIRKAIRNGAFSTPQQGAPTRFNPSVVPSAGATFLELPPIEDDLQLDFSKTPDEIATAIDAALELPE